MPPTASVTSPNPIKSAILAGPKLKEYITHTAANIPYACMHTVSITQKAPQSAGLSAQNKRYEAGLTSTSVMSKMSVELAGMLPWALPP
jgi:hypothetical protein